MKIAFIADVAPPAGGVAGLLGFVLAIILLLLYFLISRALGKQRERREVEVLYHPINKSKEYVKKGFCWPCLSLGCFWFFYKGMWAMAAIAFLEIVILTTGLFVWPVGLSILVMIASWFAFANFANELYRQSLLRKGYLVESQLAQSRSQVSHGDPIQITQPLMAEFIADELSKLVKLRDSGVLTEEEFNAQKKKLLS